jgi:hypothetical protein
LERYLSAAGCAEQPRSLAEQDRHDVDANLVGEPEQQALAGEVATEYLHFLAVGGQEGGGDGGTDVAGEEGDGWMIRGVKRGIVGQDELRSRPRAAVGLPGFLPGVAPPHLVGSSAGEDRARGCDHLRELVRGHVVEDPGHRVIGSRDQSVE